MDYGKIKLKFGGDAILSKNNNINRCPIDFFSLLNFISLLIYFQLTTENNQVGHDIC